jgi:hypothetical protein
LAQLRANCVRGTNRYTRVQRNFAQWRAATFSEDLYRPLPTLRSIDGSNATVAPDPGFQLRRILS